MRWVHMNTESIDILSMLKTMFDIIDTVNYVIKKSTMYKKIASLFQYLSIIQMELIFRRKLALSFNIKKKIQTENSKWNFTKRGILYTLNQWVPNYGSLSTTSGALTKVHISHYYLTFCYPLSSSLSTRCHYKKNHF